MPGATRRSSAAFPLQWYGKTLSNPFVSSAVKTSFTVAVTSALLATLFGTLAAVALQGVRGRVRLLYDALIYVAVMVPGIVIGIATLIALVTVFDCAQPAARRAVRPGEPGPARSRQGLADRGAWRSSPWRWSSSSCAPGCRDGPQSLIEASADLYAPPLRSFARSPCRRSFPAILAGFLLAFTFSFDDFIIAFFVAGSETTLPIYVFSSIRRGVTPEINAIGTLVLAASLLSLITAQVIMRRRSH